MKKAATNRSLSLTGGSSCGFVQDTSAKIWPNDNRRINGAHFLLGRLRSERNLIEIGLQLAELGRQAYLLSQPQLVDSVCQAILELPLPPSIRCIGAYYALPWDPNRLESLRQPLAKIADEAAPGLRERAVLQLGRTYFRYGDVGSASYYFTEAARASKESDFFVHLKAHRFLAMCRSAEGDHVGAASLLDRLWRPMQAIRGAYPAEYLDYLNSVAVELGHLGNVVQAKYVLSTPLSSQASKFFPTWFDTKRELDESEANSAKAPPLVFAIGSVFEPASQLEGESRAEVSIGTRPVPAPETERAQEAEPLAQPRPAHDRAIATSYKREAIPLAAIPLVITFRCAPALVARTSEKCSVSRSRPRVAHDFWRYIRSKPARAPPSRVLFLD